MAQSFSTTVTVRHEHVTEERVLHSAKGKCSKSTYRGTQTSADTKSAFRQRFVQVGILLNIKSLDIRGNECGSAKWSPCIAQGPQATHLLLIGYEARRMGRGVGSREMTGHMFPGLSSQ